MPTELHGGDGPERQEFVNPAIGPGGELFERVLEPGIWLQAIELGRGEQALDRGGAAAGAF